MLFKEISGASPLSDPLPLLRRHFTRCRCSSLLLSAWFRPVATFLLYEGARRDLNASPR